MLQVEPLRAFHDNYIWLIHQDDQAVVIDPGQAEPARRALREKGLNLAAILLTHGHADHVGGVAALRDMSQVPVFGPADSGIEGITHPVRDGEILPLPAIHASFEVLDVSAHTRHDVAYFGHGGLFCGDTLFTGGSGRLFVGPAAKMFTALARIRALPEDTLIYCGHEYTTENLAFARRVEPDNPEIQARVEEAKRLRAADQPTVPAPLALEKATNPFLRWDAPAVRASAEQFAGKPLEPAQVYATIRKWRDSLN